MSDVAGMKAMLAGVFAKAAEAKGKAVRKPPPPDPRRPAAPSRTGAEPAVLLDVGQRDGAVEAVGDPLAGAPPPGLDGRLDAAMPVMARDLGRLLTAFGADDGATDAVLRAFAGRFGTEDRRTAAAMLDGALTGAVVAVQGVDLSLAPGVPPQVHFDRATLSMEHPPGEAPALGLAAMLGALRSARRPSPEPGLTIRADEIDADALDHLTTALSRAMTAPPPQLQGWLEGQAILSPDGAVVDGEPLALSLDLKAALPPSAAAPANAASDKAVGAPIREPGFDVRI
ncbi:hypothetical protein [Azospirillum sp. TSO35-2]|uniref:hypothetical protein n=1 Tax=Azospirillum sp. TSO35-2 TaxID=716796 RepID=UPI000D6174D5|nr:hypothetical protein [Azospirillum sp. TSO35-2]PWC39295.1 hypothetical protein TSO352_03655 [Azospirillum sp. TSO35-2]